MASRPAGSMRAGLLVLAAGLLVGMIAGLVMFVGLPEQWPWAPAAGGAAGPVATPAPAPVVGAPAPDFSLATSTSSNQPMTLSALKGQVVLINFWATWCIPCKLEMPAIQRKYDVLKGQGFTVLGVDDSEPADAIQAFAGSLNLDFPILLDPGAAINQLYHVRGYPTSFFVDRQGRIAVEHVGMMSEVQLEDYLTKLGLGG
jgi:peroxiredoxin